MGSFKCDSCFHKKVCQESPVYGSVMEDCPSYIKVENSDNTQQLKAKISEFRESLEWYRDNVDRGYANGFLNKLDEIQKLSAV